jgi:hypothetical protein
MPLVVGALKRRDLPQFKCVNTLLGNLKTTPAVASTEEIAPNAGDVPRKRHEPTLDFSGFLNLKALA